MPKEEKVGYHKGALEALLNERAELARILKIVNSLVEKHADALENEGVDVERFIENLQKQQEERVRAVQKASEKKTREEDSFDLSDEELPE